MATAGNTQRQELDISVESATVWFYVGDAVSYIVEAMRRGDAWTVATLELRESPTPSGGLAVSGVTIGPGDDQTDPRDANFPWVGVRVTATVEAASEKIDVYCHSKRDA